jgi:hypothetical protein
MAQPIFDDEDCSTHGRCELDFVKLVDGTMTFTTVHQITKKPPAYGQTTNDPWYQGYIFSKVGAQYTVAKSAPDYRWYEQK